MSTGWHHFLMRATQLFFNLLVLPFGALCLLNIPEVLTGGHDTTGKLLFVLGAGGVAGCFFAAFFSWAVFRWGIPARCPRCGERKAMRAGWKPASYRCRSCGNLSYIGIA
jgi:hypothetical protein